MRANTFMEVGHYQARKHRERVCGDVFHCQKMQQDERLVAVLSDGLGSGIKASVLATLSATMAMRFVANYRDVKNTARIIMRTLPVCRERKISYSTFTILDVDQSGFARAIEYGNPGFLLFRAGEPVDLSGFKEPIQLHSDDPRAIDYSHFPVHHGDRIVFFSDGVTQSGMGTTAWPLGWGQANVQAQIQQMIAAQPLLSARALAKHIVLAAQANDNRTVKDDISCGVIYLRKPRKMLLVTGPPFHADRDKELSARVAGFDGETVLCGGTTANIVARELARPIQVDLAALDPEIPPPSTMPGISLVTEGILTLCKVNDYLERGLHPEWLRPNAATRVLEQLLNSDVVHFVVGTRINEVHQDPNMPVEIEIRRNIIKRMKRLLEEKHLKKVFLEYL